MTTNQATAPYEPYVYDEAEALREFQAACYVKPDVERVESAAYKAAVVVHNAESEVFEEAEQEYKEARIAYRNCPRVSQEARKVFEAACKVHQYASAKYRAAEDVWLAAHIARFES